MHVNFDCRVDAMKTEAHHDLHELAHANSQKDGMGENVLTILILLSALFIPFAFIVHFYPG